MATSTRIAASAEASPSLVYEQPIGADDEDDDDDDASSPRHEPETASGVYANFVAMSLLFSANHGCVVACLGLATARLGSTGAWQSGLLYLTYTGSAVTGATYIVQRLQARNALMLGMMLYCCYVAAFWWGTTLPAHAVAAALTGAAIGGVGAGFLWTAQGAFFVNAAKQHAWALQQPLGLSTAKLASVFAFFYLAMELVLRSLSSVLLQAFNVEWSTVFAVYSAVALLSTTLMVLVRQPDEQPDDERDDSSASHSSVWYKVTVALQLLCRDPKMPYMIGLNAVFGFTSAFLNSYVNGQVVDVVLHDATSKNLGLLTAWVSVVAATMSLVFGRATARVGKGPILTVGAACFSLVALPFVLLPNIERQWSPIMLVAVYTVHGIGRATFEGTLKATFADFFPHEKEGAFANIIVQNGLASAIGFVLSFNLTCRHKSAYCVAYNDGTLHNVLTFEWMIVVTAIFAVWGYWKADAMHSQRDGQGRPVWTRLLDNAAGVST
jgi:hypothetical protein